MIILPTNPTENTVYIHDGVRYIYKNQLWKVGQSLSEARSVAKVSELRIGITPTLFNADLITSSDTLYIHRYNGNSIALYDSDSAKWSLYGLPASPLSFSFSTIVPDRLHDVYLYHIGGEFAVEFLAWQDNLTAPARGLQDGTRVRNGFPNRKYIGTILTSETIQNQVQNRHGSTALTKLNAVEQSPRQGFINMYNRVPTPYVLKFSDGFAENTGGNWKFPEGYSSNAAMTVLNVDYQLAECNFSLYVPEGATTDISASMSIGSTTPSVYSGLVTRTGTGEFTGSSAYNARISSAGTHRLYYLTNSTVADTVNAGNGGFIVTVLQ